MGGFVGGICKTEGRNSTHIDRDKEAMTKISMVRFLFTSFFVDLYMNKIVKVTILFMLFTRPHCGPTNRQTFCG